MSILLQAETLINGPRADAYGKASIGWVKVAKHWSVIFGVEVTAKQCLLAMIMLKVTREQIKPDIDNLIDIGGYAGVIEKLLKELKDEFDAIDRGG